MKTCLWCPKQAEWSSLSCAVHVMESVDLMGERITLFIEGRVFSSNMAALRLIDGSPVQPLEEVMWWP